MYIANMIKQEHEIYRTKCHQYEVTSIKRTKEFVQGTGFSFSRILEKYHTSYRIIEMRLRF